MAKKEIETIIEPAKENNQGGKKGMHHGHKYSEVCNCIVCRRTGLKKIKDLSERASIINEYVENLPDDKVLFTINDEIAEAIMAKLPQLKERFPGDNVRTFMNDLINTSLTTYLNAL